MEHVDGELQRRQAIEIGVHDDVGDIAMDEDLAGREVDDLVRRHAAVRAADPEIARRLLLLEVGEEIGLAGAQIGGPGVVAQKQITKRRHRVGPVDGSRDDTCFAPQPAMTLPSRAIGKPDDPVQ